ncbi:hypothetical protein ACFOQM_10565 [Paenibacillus sp. GCM10012307]|uniref:Uncharacterized protein n=1 Tax=Paenibacillus roseus TaxID=2798579 RepID=A0A934J2S1_9BACL|nr:hypothetical protein [Paenibacillus roseus]MBJ6361725.1 hypothetical protein [Paenibacillus roseus]
MEDLMRFVAFPAEVLYPGGGNKRHYDGQSYYHWDGAPSYTGSSNNVDGGGVTGGGGIELVKLFSHNASHNSEGSVIGGDRHVSTDLRKDYCWWRSNMNNSMKI